MRGPKPASLVDRLIGWRHIHSDTGCWLPVHCNDWNKYFKITYRGEKRLIHRLSAVAFLGMDLFSKLQTNHKPNCSYKACFNPEHIYIGTAKENGRDYSNSKTHCKNRHELTISNTYITILKNGLRKGQIVKNCRECNKLNKREERRNKR